ncbi:MAG: hypothetical protein ACK5LK_00415 [Chthoniobacterales bacterium]
MEQLVILIVIGLLSLINWIIQKSKEYKDQKAELERRANTPNYPAQAGQATPIANSPERAQNWEVSDAGLQDFYKAIGVESPVETPTEAEPTSSPEESPYFESYGQESYQEEISQQEFYQQETYAKPVYEAEFAGAVSAPPPLPDFAAQEAAIAQPDEAKMALARRLEAAETSTPVIQKMPQIATESVRGFLKSPQALRKAILLKEILGKPRALSGL